MNQQTKQPDWSTAPDTATHWSPANQRYYTMHNRQRFTYAEKPQGAAVHINAIWRNQLIPRPAASAPARLQRFDKRRLAERTMVLGTDNSVAWLSAGTKVTVGGYVQFDPQWHEVITIHWDSPEGVGYVTTIAEGKLLPLETPEEQAARKQIEALYQVLVSNPGSYYAEQAHQLYDAGCRMPLDQDKDKDKE